ncbi:MAG TPA: BatA and WFA domain-containing protein [Chthoniobacteraceae bacterium]|nr:BatA and WFA domain-containing protein [Chthoniobacteraceae bacterium]
MSLLSPWMLYGFAALAAPIIIHLWQRRRVVQVNFSTLRFLKLVAAKTSRSSRIENIILLLLRCLIFALLALAAARPVISTKAAKLFGGDAPRTVVLAIDNSMSMGYRPGDDSRLESAKKEALAVIDDLKPGDDVAIFTVGDRVDELIAEPTVDHRVARETVESIRQSEDRSDFSAVFREARKIVAQGSHGIRELYFFTDNQDYGWRFDANPVFDDAWTKSDLHSLIVRPDDLAAANSAVSEVRIQTPFITPGNPFSASATVANFSARSSQDLLEVKFNGGRVAQKPLDLAPGASVEVPLDFQPPPIEGRWVRAVAAIQGDNLPADDQFYFTVPVYQPPRVLIVEGQEAGAAQLHSGYFLGKALTAGETDVLPARTVPAPELEETTLGGYSAVFLADVPGLSDRALVRLDDYLQGGGTVVLFPGDLASVTNLAHMDFLPAKPAAIRELPAGRLSTKILDPANPLFADAWDSNTPFPALPQHKIIDWKINPDAKALITFSNNAPFLIFGNRGPGRVMIVNASADRSWGDFPLSPAFLPLVQQIARLSAEQTGGKAGFTVGDAIPMAANIPRDEALTIKYPDGSTHDLPAGDRTQLVERTEQSGFYEISSAKQGTLEVVAVNADRRESNLKPIDDSALSKILPIETINGIDNLKLWLARSRGNVPVWPVLLVLALAAFAAEAILANVMARNRAQGDAQHIQTGRLNKRRIGVSFRPSEMEVKT